MQLARKIEGKKFMWDGVEYQEGNDAQNAKDKYIAAGFETVMLAEENKFYLFTRKVVTEVIVEGTPPI